MAANPESRVEEQLWRGYYETVRKRGMNSISEPDGLAKVPRAEAAANGSATPVDLTVGMRPPVFALLPKLFEEIRIAKDASWANMTGAKCFHTDHDQGGSWLYLGNIGKCWKEAFDKHYSLSHKFLHNITMFHLGYEELEHSAFWEHFVNLGKLYEATARNLDTQQGNLNLVKDKKTLRQDSALFVQYVLSQYLNCSSGWAQFQRLTLIEIPASLEQSFPFMKPALVTDMKLFHDAEKYRELSKLIGLVAPTFQNTPLIACSLLFRTEVCRHSAADRQFFLLKNEESTTSKLLKLNFKSLIHSLGQISSAFQESASWSWNQNQVFKVSKSFRALNELWFQIHAYCIGKAYESVSLGPDLIKEFVMCNISGITMGKKRLSQFFNMIVVRMIRILWSHDPDKTVLKPLLEKEVMSKSVFIGLAVWWARFEGTKNGNQQLDFIIGTQDKKVLYESNLDQAIPNRSLSALRILIINQNLNIFPSSEVSEILAAMAALQPLVGDFRLFTLFLLLAMFSIKESAGCEAMAEMRKQYDDLLMAKFSGIWSARTARQKIQESLEAATKLGSYAKKLTLVDISEEKPRTPTVPASPVITIS